MPKSPRASPSKKAGGGQVGSSSSGSILLMDNGASNVKYGLADTATQRAAAPTEVTNCCARMGKQMQVLVADQVDAVHNGSSLNYIRPFDRGYVTNWGVEIDVWNRIFAKDKIVPKNIGCLVVTEPLFNPETLQNDFNEVVFEEFEFDRYLRRPSAWFSAYQHAKTASLECENPNCSVVVESGFSFTHSVPFINGRLRPKGVRRVNIGGKLLTNYLKEMVSFRQWNMMDEFKLMDQVKEDLCFVSDDFSRDMQRYQLAYGANRLSSNQRDAALAALSDTTLGRQGQGGLLKQSFILPDFQTRLRGCRKPDDLELTDDDQVLAMETERFTVPELLFTPSDVGMDQAGVAEACWDGVQQLPLLERAACLQNVLLTGGNANFPNYDKRFTAEFRSYVDDTLETNCRGPGQTGGTPQHHAYRGMQTFVTKTPTQDLFNRLAVSRAEYQENGHHYCNEKFAHNIYS